LADHSSDFDSEKRLVTIPSLKTGKRTGLVSRQFPLEKQQVLLGAAFRTAEVVDQEADADAATSHLLTIGRCHFSGLSKRSVSGQLWERQTRGAHEVRQWF
jgi:hypothetical protein